MNKTVFRYLIVLAGLFFLIGDSQGYKPLTKEQISAIMPTKNRVVVSLAGNWQRSVNDTDWETVSLPASETVDNAVSYERVLKIDKSMIRQYAWHLYFLGFDDQAAVFLNNQFIGKYFCGGSPIYVRIPDKLLAGDANVLRIVVTPATASSRQVRTQFPFAKRIYTGLFREVLLVGMPNIWVSDVKYKINYNADLTQAQVKSSISISSGEIEKLFGQGASRDSLDVPGLQKVAFAVDVSLKRKLTGETVAQSGQRNIKIERERTISENFDMGVSFPNLWTLDNPYLYELTVKIIKNGITIDEHTTDLGFRSVNIHSKNNEKAIYLNNQKLEIKGVTYIEDHEASRQSLSPYRMEEDILAMKTLGANAIRFRFTPPHPYMLHLCDKNGMLAMVELPMYDVPTAIVELDEIIVRMKNIAKQYLTAYDNHPSLFAYGVSDGIEEGTEAARYFSNSVTSLFKTSSKLIYKIVNFKTQALDIENYDFIGFRDNRKFKNFDEIKNEIVRLKALAQSKPVFITYGFPIQPDNHNGYSDQLSIEYQAYYIRNSYYVVREQGCAGSIISAFNDYEPYNPLLITDYSNQYLCPFGLVDRSRKERLAYFTLQALFNAEQEPLLNAGSYSEKTPVSFIVVGLLLGIVIIFLTNRFRRFREYIFRSVFKPYNFYADIRDQRIMFSFQTVILGIVISMIMGIFFASLFYFYRTNELAQYIWMMLIPNQSMQEIFYRIVWMPLLMMFIISLTFFLLIVVISFIIRVFALFKNARISYGDSMVISIWAGAPVLLLLPFAIILIRLLVFSQSMLWISLLVSVLLMIWVMFRLMRSAAVVFDSQTLKAYFAGMTLLVIFIGIPAAIYHFQYSFFAYSEYFIDVMLK